MNKHILATELRAGMTIILAGLTCEVTHVRASRRYAGHRQVQVRALGDVRVAEHAIRNTEVVEVCA